MKILAWNLNHRTLEKEIPESILQFFSALAPDLIVLNEFVDGPTRATFREALDSIAYSLGNPNVYAAHRQQVFPVVLKLKKRKAT